MLSETQQQQMVSDISTVRENVAGLKAEMGALRGDVGEIKEDIKTATDIMSQLHIHFIPRTENDKQIELSERAEIEQNRKIASLEKDVEKLKLWRKGLSTAISLVTGGAIIAFEYLKQWTVGAHH